MSGYPPTNSFGYSSDQSQPAYPFPSQAYPNTNSPGYPSNPSYPYPSQQPDIMSNTTGYPAAGYPSSNAAGIPSSGGYPNAGGYPAPGNVPDSAGGVPNPGFTPAVCPSAPDLSQIEKIPGYEKLTFEDEIVMPPTMPDWKPEVQDRKEVENLPSLTEEDVREAALQYVGEHCCYGSGAARNMVITNITMMSAFHYKLETFGEKRESAWRFVPYINGQPIDGPMNGPAPRPWDVVVSPSSFFTNSKMKMEVPHTAFIKPCHTCVGNGRVRCNDCTGYGKSQCTWCRGRGTRSNFDNEMCTSCNGTGSSRCTWCDGTGQVKCKNCNGRGQLKGFVELTITWTNHVDDYISETSSMPKELVRQVTGQIAFEEEYPRVYPIMHAPDQAVRNASNEFVTKHSTAFPNERVLKQRHCLRLIPIGEVNYMYKEKAGVFYVYGYEHKVYFADYPQKCCCCSII